MERQVTLWADRGGDAARIPTTQFRKWTSSGWGGFWGPVYEKHMNHGECINLTDYNLWDWATEGENAGPNMNDTVRSVTLKGDNDGGLMCRFYIHTNCNDSQGEYFTRSTSGATAKDFDCPVLASGTDSDKEVSSFQCWWN
eukprot:TRINITY_DN75162_c0_g1_i1.p1 TRINITY_DN75162_c0_g1~~TRINITY_DN75162_c0_g1_i1.p1  ORF type:complete len:161 (+),score=16.78 TRINITY_DN75162_c0_g1_i1:63-485(+)